MAELTRLEDFITLAKEGKEIEMTVELKKQLVSQKVHPDETEEMRDEIEMYLLLADYAFKVGGETKKVSKIYVHGISGEPLNVAKQNISIANARLKMDYARLREANIKFEEQYW